MATMDAYIRVSRVGDREGDAYRSPAIQREEIERWAARNGVQIGKVVVEQDVSGGRPVAERKLEELIARSEAGETGGVLVYRLDRFSRDMAATAVAVKRLRDADARLVAVADGLDSAAPNGQIVIAVMSALAEQHLENVKTNWQAATSRAVDSGIHIASKAPVGYRRLDAVQPERDSKNRVVRNGRLVLEPDEADAVKTAFEMRADGDSYRVIAEFLAERLARGVAKSTVLGILKNRAYLGEARGPGGLVKADAHPPIVSEELFGRVQARVGAYTPRNGTLAKQALLSGVITCASCGHKLRTLGSKNRDGGRDASYVCAKRYASGDCELPASARVRLVDEFVLEELQRSAETASARVATAESRYLAAKEKVNDAEEALDIWVDDPAIAVSVGRERFQRGLLARQKALEEARHELWALDDPGLGEVETVTVDGKPYVYELWGEDREADKRHLRRHIRSVTLAKADPARRRWQPIDERVSVEWVGD